LGKITEKIKLEQWQ